MKSIRGTVVEHSSYEVYQNGVQLYHEVRIKGDDGRLYAVKKAAVDPRLANALSPNNHGRFHFSKVFLGNNVLVAAEFDGRVEVASIGGIRLALFGLGMILLGIPLILFFGIGLLMIAMGVSMLLTVIRRRALLARLGGSGTAIQVFQTV